MPTENEPTEGADEAVGYLDSRSQSFMQTVMELTEALDLKGRPRILMRRRGKPFIVLFAVVALSALTGCGGSAVTGEELLDQARGVNLAYKAAVADVQVQLYDGQWTLEGYGDSPDQCGDDGYMFRLGRSTPFEWRFEGTPGQAGERIAAWLDENGWSDIKTRTYSGDVDNVLVEAEKPDSHVALLTIDFNPGQRSDMITINADSTCEPGDWLDLIESFRPGVSTGESVPTKDDRTTEAPTDNPSFGYNEDGTPRFWDDEGD